MKEGASAASYCFPGSFLVVPDTRHIERSQEQRISYVKTSTIELEQKFNNFLDINLVLRVCNARLTDGGFLYGFFETLDQRRAKIRARTKSKFWAMVLIYFDFILRRVLPKIFPFKQINDYFHIVRNLSLSECEVFGRLYFCGFEPVEYYTKDAYFYFKAKKVKEPLEGSVNYGLLIKLPRVGKHGKTIHIYKLRTMHAYAQYLQDYIIRKNGFAKNGKISDDFRVPDWGRVLRRSWLDELPQFINLIKGDVGIFGVRPLSQGMFDLYPAHLQNMRTRVKPGLIPPFYADMPGSLEEVMASEEQYLKKRLQQPVKTDVVYMVKALRNIVKGARSA